jgi:hypothetical protein
MPFLWTLEFLKMLRAVLEDMVTKRSTKRSARVTRFPFASDFRHQDSQYAQAAITVIAGVPFIAAGRG